MAVTIDGTNGINDTVLGSSTPAEATVTTFTSNGIDDNADAVAITINSSEQVGIGTTDTLLFNAVGGSTKLAVVGDSASTSVTGNTLSSISIINKDGTASNTAGLHFARADTDESPNYAGASIVAQFGEAQVTGQYPSADINFLTSTSQNSAPSSKMILTAAGNVGIGTAVPKYLLDVGPDGATSLAGAGITLFSGSSLTSNIGGVLNFRPALGLTASEIFNLSICAYDHGGDGNADGLSINGFDGVSFCTGANTRSERMRIDSGGSLLFGTTNASFTAGVGIKFSSSTVVPAVFNVMNTAGSENTYHLYNTNATNNGYRFYVGVNGGVNNFSANNTNLSDIRVKTNIELSGDYLSKICAIPVKLFNYKDDPADKEQNLGVIAQDVEAVAPEFVNTEGFGETPEDGIPLKSIYTTDMQYALMKCIQEQQAIITALEARIIVLEG